MNLARPFGLIVRREIVERARSRAFIWSSVFTILIVLAVILVPGLLGGRPEQVRIGTVGEGNDPIVAAATRIAEEDPEAEIEVSAVRFADEEEARRALEEGDVDLVLVDGVRLLVPAEGFMGGGSGERLVTAAATAVEIDRLAAAGEVDTVRLLVEGPLRREVVGEGEQGDPGRFVVAYGGLVLMYVAVLTYGMWTLSGVTEEKASRVVEILLVAVPPRLLLAGKVVGIGSLGLAQFTVTIGAALVALQATSSFELPAVSVGQAVILVLWFLLGYALYAVMFGTAGALVSRPEDAQTAAFPFTVVAVLGFFVSFQVLDDPTGPVAVAGTLIPLSAPFVVPIRHAMEAIPLWQSVAAVVSTVAVILGLVRLGGRVYAGGLLRYRGRVGWREAFRSAEF
ncbi:MAG: ABC transporter permease [Acidimicrobiia bacterium]|nr:MAG: ABC transporter permease [Acidimicrobiia bacterium]